MMLRGGRSDHGARLGRWYKLGAILAGSFCVAWVLPLIGAASAASGGPCGPPVTNMIACENSLPGDPPSDWQINGSGDPSIQGFATSMSVNAGQTESFKINTPSTAYHIDILRLGYYQGLGARKVASNLQPTALLPQAQPNCLTDSTTGLIDCGNWGVSASWTVPANAVSGVYIAHLVRDDPADPGGGSQILFVVRNDLSHSDILLQTSDATWEAYNDYGGNSLYTCTVDCPSGNPLAYKGADAVSYNRPFDGTLAIDGGRSDPYYAEYQMIRFLEENGYDVSYVSSGDVDRAGSLLLHHKLFISSGHDEYWSAGQRASVVAARDAGVNLAFFSGNEMFWKTRWAPSQDGSNTAYRTLVTYKETHFNSPVDPQDPPTWTGTWADPRFSPPADGGVPANGLTGQEFLVNSGTADITVPYQYSKLRIWRNTAVADLSPGQSRTLAAGTGTLGYEWDVDADNGFRPPGEFDLSSTTVSGVQPFTDYGSLTGTGTETHHLTLYKAPSGALVFGAGTVQWAWGLDDTNAWGSSGPPGGSTPDPTMQQATVNLFADMGVQPTTLISGLTPATRSTDTAPPTSKITSPTAGSSFQDGSAVTVSGTATDPGGGGAVAGVVVSTNGGGTWHPATLTTPDGPTVGWSYSWIAEGNPATTIMSRAIDDSGNIESPSPGVTVSVACPCSLWGVGTPGGATDSADNNAVTVGMKFKSDVYGTVTALRFYKVAANTGTHVGSLWTANGTLLASATFTNETASGWQQVALSNPVTIMPNTTYVVSYNAPNGHYAYTENYFYPEPSPGPIGGGSTNNPPLHAIPSNTSGNGVWVYGAANAFPTNSDVSAENYWVDVEFSPATPTLTVTPTGTGSGKVTSSSSGIDCGTTCSGSFTSGSTVTLTESPASGSTFAGWSGGGCSGTARTCQVTMSSDQAVTATFNTSPPPSFTLTVAKAGSGSGTVTSGDGQIDCGTTCSGSFTSGSTVTLTESPASGSTFAGWSGARCSSTARTCQVTMSSDQAVTATFNTSPPPSFTLTVAKAGSGSGTVTSGDGQIDCGTTCSGSFTSGSTVTLTESPASGSTFAGWSGARCSSTGACTVSISADTQVRATFIPGPLLSTLGVSPGQFALTGRFVTGRCVAATVGNRKSRVCVRAIALRVSYKLTIAGRVTFTVKQELAGRLTKGRCVPVSRTNQKQHRCARLVPLGGSFVRTSAAGTTTFTFNGQLAGRKLAPGSYQLTASPTATGHTGTPQSIRFQLVR